MTTTGTVQEWMDAREMAGLGSVIGWKIYYSDRVLCSKNAIPDDCPDQDVQCYVVWHRKDGGIYKEIIDGVDEYWLIGATRPKYGRELPEDEFRKISQTAVNAIWIKNGN